MTKNPGLGARVDSVSAALAAHGSKTAAPAKEEQAGEPLIATSLRLPKSVHQALRKIAFEEEISIHSLLLDGAKMVIAKKAGKSR